MKSSKNTNLLLLVFVLLLGSTVLVQLLSRNRYAPVESAQASEAMFPGIDKDSVARLVIEGPESKHVELAREGDQWKVASEGGYLADKTRVEQAVAAIVDLKQGRVISSNPEALPDFKLAGDQAIQVSARDGEGHALASVVIGKGTDYASSYFKIPDQTAVRKLNEAIRSTFEAAQGWRDRTILKEGVEADVMRLEITGPGGPVVLEREEVKGPKEEGAAADSVAAADTEKTDTDTADGDQAEDKGRKEEVKEVVWNQLEPMSGRATKWLCDSMARSMTSLDCDSFYSGEKSRSDLGLDPPRYTVRALFKEEGKSTEILLGDKDDNKYPVTMRGSDTIWWIPSFRGDYFTKEPKQYLENPPPEEEQPAAEGEAPAAEGETPAVEGETPAVEGDAPPATEDSAIPPAPGQAPATLEQLSTQGGETPGVAPDPTGKPEDGGDGKTSEAPAPDGGGA